MTLIRSVVDDMRNAGSARPDRSPLRVLHVVPSLLPGGMERALVRLIRATSQAGDSANAPLEHGLCILKNADESLVAECRPYARVWTLRASSRRRQAPWASWWRLRRVVSHFRPSIVHARSTAGWLDTAVALRGMPGPRLVLGFHGKVTLDAPSLKRRLINRWCIRRAQAIVAVSQEAAEMMRTQWSARPDKLTVLHNGVDVERFQPADGEARRIAREQLGLSPQHRVVVCIANLVPIKGLDVLLRAWTHVQANDAGARLLLAGDGPLRNELVQLAQTLGCAATVQFLGRCADVTGPLRCADVAVLPSRYEGCSNALLESMACGLPVIACNVGGNRELIGPQHAGWLVSPESPEELAQTLVRVLLDDVGRAQVGAAARAHAVESFSMHKWAESYIRFYRLMAGMACSSPSTSEACACVE